MYAYETHVVQRKQVTLESEFILLHHSFIYKYVKSL